MKTNCLWRSLIKWWLTCIVPFEPRVSPLVTTPLGTSAQNAEILAAIDRVKSRFEHASLSGKTMPNPPVRGPNVSCVFQLLSGAVPKKAHGHRMAGEREAAIANLMVGLVG